MKLTELYKNKRVLILGLGLNQGGLGAARFFAKAGADLRVTDLKSKKELKDSLDELRKFKNIKYILGEHRYVDFDWADLVIKNPAVKPNNPYLEYTHRKNILVETDMGLFLQFCRADQIIGVTGTKGKSTTASLIYQALKIKYPQQVLFAGNIGKSVLDTVPFIKDDSLLVLELSSFQLEGFDEHRVSPRWAVITNVLPDHLNYYDTMKRYIAAKRLIVKHQQDRDYLFISKDDKVANRPSFLKGVESKIVLYSLNDIPKNFVSVLPGEHNRRNIAAALAVTKVLGVRQSEALWAMNKFKGVPFRLQLIKNARGVKIYNDTSATGPDAGVQALKALPDSILICGGVNKNLLYKDYAKEVDRSAKLVYFLEGDATREIKKLMKNKRLIQGTYDNLEAMIKAIKKVVQPGDTILFSPAAASFNLFQNEFDRGRRFNSAVEKLF